MTIAYRAIGQVHLDQQHAFIEIAPEFRPGLVGLDDFSFIHVLWQADRARPLSGDALVVSAPYRNGPERIGVFATRSPARPNPVCFTVAPLVGVDIATGRVDLAWLDCEDKTPVLDIKPYHPSADRLASAPVPDWCAAWPKSLEESGSFDWSSVFSF